MIRKVQSGAKFLLSTIALVSAELLVLFGAFFITLGLLIIVIRQIFFRRQDALDHYVFDYLSPYITGTNTAIIQFFTFFGSQQFLIPAFMLLLAWYYFIHKNKWYFIKILIIAISNLLLMFSLKYLFNRPRPLVPLLKEVPGLSFPSGHAFMGLTFFGLLIYIIYHDVSNKWVKWISIFNLVIFILMVGLSRVYLRVHYASDVIGGFCFGILSLMILLFILRQIEKFNFRKKLRHLTADEEDKIDTDEN